MDFEKLLSPENLTQLGTSAIDWVLSNVFVLSNAVQLGLLALGLLVAWYLSPKINKLLRSYRPAGLQRIVYSLTEISLPLVWLLQVWFFMGAASLAEFPSALLNIVSSLLGAWVVIKMASRLVQEPILARGVAIIAWIIAALNIVGLLDPTIELLDSQAMSVGEVRISLYTVIKSTLALSVLLWAAMQASTLLERRIKTSSSLSPSVQVLLSKSLSIVLIGVAIIVALQTVGIDLTALAVFGGAVGLGVGFGLQKIVGNLISGVILLLDKSIKPGDVIAVDNSYGWVNALGARYVSVITRDGTEHLIPNELLITERVENWTHSDSKRRVRVPVGIHYNSNVEQAIELCVEAAQSVERVLDDPPVACLLTEFGDNSVNLEVRFWIRDAHNGLANVRSAVMLKIWNAFKQYEIEIPYPQRDLHVRSADELGKFFTRATGSGPDTKSEAAS